MDGGGCTCHQTWPSQAVTTSTRLDMTAVGQSPNSEASAVDLSLRGPDACPHARMPACPPVPLELHVDIGLTTEWATVAHEADQRPHRREHSGGFFTGCLICVFGLSDRLPRGATCGGSSWYWQQHSMAAAGRGDYNQPLPSSMPISGRPRRPACRHKPCRPTRCHSWKMPFLQLSVLANECLLL